MSFRRNVFHAVTATVLLLSATLFDAGAQTGMGVGTATPTQKLDVNGAIRIGNTGTGNAGAIRWNGTAFEGHDGTQWIQFGGGSQGWSLTGNAGTTPATNFLGTTDNQALHFRTNNTDKLIITSAGNIGVGTNNPAQMLHVYKSGADAIVRIESPGSANEARLEFWKFGGLNAAVGYYPGNADLKLRTNTNNSIVFEPNGVEQMRVAANGNVGIGTINPATDLHVVGNIRMVDGNQAANKVMRSDANGTATWVDPSTLIANDGDWTISGNNEYSAVSGNVGIGSTTPAYKLDVNGTFQATGGGTFGNNVQITGNYYLDNTNGTGSNNPPFRLDGFNDKLYIIAENSATGPATGTEIRFRTASTNTTAADRVVIDKDGNMGVGITTPSEILHLKRNGSDNYLRIDANSTGSGYAGIRLAEPGFNYGWFMRFNAAAGGLHFAFNNNVTTTDYVTILPSGNVGIGTTNPGDELHIVGSIRMVDGNQANGKVMVSNANGTASWADPATLSDGDWTTSGNNIYNANTGNVGVGTTNPLEKLHVVGNQRIQAGRLEFTNTGNSVFVGDDAGLNDDFTNNGNTFIGNQAGMANTTGGNNVAVGNGALIANTTASFNTAIGWGTMAANTTGNNSTAVGHWALHANTTGVGNLALGSHAIGNNITGNNNTAVGVNAGQNNTGSGNIFLGRFAGQNETGDNTLYIDNSNTTTPLIHGNFQTNELGIWGNLGIGTNDPVNTLEVKGRSSIGTNYAGTAAPNNGLIVEGVVGIGTSNPNRLLTVGNSLSINVTPKATINSDGNQPLLVGENTNNKAVMIGYDGNDIQGRSGTNLTTNGDLLLNRYGGNVGVGTTAPAQKLDVNGKIQMRTGAVAGYIPVSDANGTMTWTNPTSISDGDWTISGSNQYSAVTGNVGIGTTSPVNKLHVEGTTHMTDNVTINVASTSGKGITFRDGYEGRYHVGLNVYDHSGNGGGFADGLAVSGYDGLSFITGNTTSTYSNVRMFISLGGNVGIGTTNPADELHVAGSIRMVDGN